MPFRTQYIQTDGSINVDGSIYLRQVPLSTGANISGVDIASYVNTSTYYDASIQNRYLPNPSSLTGIDANYKSQGIYTRLTAGETLYGHSLVYIDSGGRARLASLDSSAKMPAVAMYTPIMSGDGNILYAGETGSFLIFGVFKYTSAGNYVVGKPVLMDQYGNAGYYEPSIAGQCKQVLGMFISEKSAIFNPSPDFVVLK